MLPDLCPLTSKPVSLPAPNLSRLKRERGKCCIGKGDDVMVGRPGPTRGKGSPPSQFWKTQTFHSTLQVRRLWGKAASVIREIKKRAFLSTFEYGMSKLWTFSYKGLAVDWSEGSGRRLESPAAHSSRVRTNAEACTLGPGSVSSLCWGIHLTN